MALLFGGLVLLQYLSKPRAASPPENPSRGVAIADCAGRHQDFRAYAAVRLGPFPVEYPCANQRGGLNRLPDGAFGGLSLDLEYNRESGVALLSQAAVTKSEVVPGTLLQGAVFLASASDGLPLRPSRNPSRVHYAVERMAVVETHDGALEIQLTEPHKREPTAVIRCASYLSGPGADLLVSAVKGESDAQGVICAIRMVFRDEALFMSFDLAGAEHFLKALPGSFDSLLAFLERYHFYKKE
ncbi:hypothetical protein [Tahibacter amnicola]|uniref:Uncharacterized protein n=1 Tax=Tahibacter amnicola TaxID=2976241 RepID=A0ABY6BS54_9GAMM|nr:hypothetical protein [Tahibacter amnicola]UXI70602.1 hypothetical protein N4264_13450 [Tahibacter amnicola]